MEEPEVVDVQVASATDRKIEQQQTPAPIANKTVKNDWELEHDTNTASEENVGVGLTFIRVIVIRRILLNHLKQNTDNNDNIDKYIKHLITYVKDSDDSIQSKVHRTLSQLLTKDGIKNYFNSWNEKDNNPNIIAIIFDKLILTKFVNEYENIIRYKSENMQNNKLYYYQDLLFNMKDLMCSIFGFLDNGKDLVKCSLVCSHWLYHVYNTSLFNVDNFKNLILNTIKYDVKNSYNDSSGVRMWQRLTKLKSIYLDLDHSTPELNQLLLNKLSSLKNVEKFRARFYTKHLPIVKIVMKNCKENIKHYSLRIRTFGGDIKKPVLSPLVLANAKHITIESLYFYIIWSYKCQELELSWSQYLDKKWCNFVINNCDCSNIKSLTFTWENFVKGDFINTTKNKEDKEGKELLKKLAQQFINLQNLKIEMYNKCDQVALLFCKYLNDIIDKNNVKIELAFNKQRTGYELDKLLEAIQDAVMGDKISKISLYLSYQIKQTFSIFEKLEKVCTSGVEWIKVTKWFSSEAVVDEIVDCLDKIAFKSLKVFEYCDTGSKMEAMNKILKMEFNNVRKSRLYMIANFRKSYQATRSCLFDAFCQTVFNLMIKDEMAINISLKIREVPDKSKYDEYYNNIYLLHFNEEKILKNYKKPQCNKKYCMPLAIPIMSFTWDDKEKCSQFVVKSAQIINK